MLAPVEKAAVSCSKFRRRPGGVLNSADIFICLHVFLMILGWL